MNNLYIVYSMYFTYIVREHKTQIGTQIGLYSFKFSNLLKINIRHYLA